MNCQNSGKDINVCTCGYCSPEDKPLVEPFALAGKAKTVFGLIELKARREQELNLMMRRQGIKELRATGKACKFWPGYRCTKPDDLTCADINCPAWKEIDGE